MCHCGGNSMWLITGGAYQGKLEYAINATNIMEENSIDGAICDCDELLRTQLVNHFHLWIKRMLHEEKNVYELVNQMMEENPNLVIIVDELGCGIVPMDPFDREYRETVGRVCCLIAKRAEEVHRVMCGIGMVIKHA